MIISYAMLIGDLLKKPVKELSDVEIISDKTIA